MESGSRERGGPKLETDHSLSSLSPPYQADSTSTQAQHTRDVYVKSSAVALSHSFESKSSPSDLAQKQERRDRDSSVSFQAADSVLRLPGSAGSVVIGTRRLRVS